MTPDRAEALDLVYNARDADDLRRGYDGWAADYDADMDRRGYVLPGFAAAMVARHVAPGEGPILDAGAGTGLLGERLARAGHRDLVAIDLSAGMLEAAARRGVYRAVRRAALGESLGFADGHFRAVVSAGTFGARHAPAGGLRELIRVARPGGHLVVTVRRLGMEEAGFPEEIRRLEAEGLWRAIETAAPFRAFPDEADSLYMAWVFEKTGQGVVPVVPGDAARAPSPPG